MEGVHHRLQDRGHLADTDVNKGAALQLQIL